MKSMLLWVGWGRVWGGAVIITFIVGCQQRRGWCILLKMSAIERKRVMFCAVYRCVFPFFWSVFLWSLLSQVSGGGGGVFCKQVCHIIEHQRVTCFALCFFPLLFGLCFCGLSCHGVRGGGVFCKHVCDRTQTRYITCFAHAMWKELKKYVPTSINNKPQVLNVYVRQFQWRFCHRHEKDLMTYTADMLAHTWKRLFGTVVGSET